MAKNHKRRAEGGRVRDDEWDGKYGQEDKDESPKDVYAGKDSGVVSQARGEMTHKPGAKPEEKKRGGKVKAEEKRNERHDRQPRKHGGAVKHVGSVEGHSGKARLDRPGRKRGGGVGSDVTPLSSAARIESRRRGEEDRITSGG